MILFETDHAKGFALPLVLGITTMLMIIILTLSDSVYRKAAIVNEFQNSIQANLKTYSALNEALFALSASTLTNTGMEVHVPHDNVPSFWNLYGDPIELSNGAQVVMRDTAGMVSPVSHGSSMLLRLLEDAQPGSGILMDVLADWQDRDTFRRLHGAEEWEYRRDNYDYLPRNALMQCVSELRLMRGFNEGLFEKIEADMIYWPAHTNYLTMRPEMLQLLLEDRSLVERVVSLRQAGTLTPSLFSAISGIAVDEDTILFPSNRLQLIVTAQVERSKSRIELVVSRQPTPHQPFTILEWRS